MLGGVYYPVDVTTYSKGRNHHLAELIASDQTRWRPTAAIRSRA